MASKFALAGLTALLATVASAQQPGKTAEVHPKLITQRCTLKKGCVDATNYLVLDSSSHPIHQATNQFNCGDWGQKPNATACPDVESCFNNCIMEGIPDYSKYGVTTNGSSLRMQQKIGNQVVTPRIYLLDEAKKEYEMVHFTGNEFTFDVDPSKLPCGMNSALYLSEMEAKGGQSKLNPGGATYGTGYCDAQCFVTPFQNGLGNVEGKGVCCNEMDIWEANARSSHIAPHTCNKPGLYLCEGDECGKEAPGVCDKAGCAWQPWRVNVTDYYGQGPKFKVDTNRKFTVITQFPADKNGDLRAIKRFYIQDGKLIDSYTVDAPGLPSVNEMTEELCVATNSKRYMDLGGHKEMGSAMTRGMVLVFSIWWDEGGAMSWLDSGEAGPCAVGEGLPSNIVKVEPFPEVTFANVRWGELGSTYDLSKDCLH